MSMDELRCSVYVLGRPQVARRFVATAAGSTEDDVAIAEVVYRETPTTPRVPSTMTTVVLHALPILEMQSTANRVDVVLCLTDADSLAWMRNHGLPLLGEAFPTTPFILCVLGPLTEAGLAATQELQESAARLTGYGGSQTLHNGLPQSMDSILPLLLACKSVVLSPLSVLWNGGSVTPLGARSLRRAFWMLDRDGDGLLNATEQQLWVLSLRAADPVDTAEKIKALTDLMPHPLRSDRGITREGFLAAVTAMLRDGAESEVWSMLRHLGANPPDASPYTSADLRSVPTTDAVLSDVGGRFFLSAFDVAERTSANLWAMGPTCPWADATGLPPPEGTTRETFLGCWRYVARKRPEAIAIFARWWGYRGSLATFFTPRIPRSLRTSPADVPSIVQVAVVGSRRCGKSELCAWVGGAVAASTNAAGSTHLLTLTPATIAGGAEALEGATMVLHDTTEITAPVFLNQRLEAMDAVWLLYDVTDAYSFSYAARWIPRLAEEKNLPVMLLATKSDLASVRGRFETSPREFCATHGIPWPPTFVSVVRPQGPTADATLAGETTPSIQTDDVASFTALCVANPTLAKLSPTTTMRRVRRVVVVAAAALVVASIVRRIASVLRRKAAT